MPTSTVRTKKKHKHTVQGVQEVRYYTIGGNQVGLITSRTGRTEGIKYPVSNLTKKATTAMTVEKAREELTGLINSKDAMAVIQFGRGLNDRIRETSTEVMDMVQRNSKNENKSIVQSMQNIIGKIDPDELQKMSTVVPKKGLEKLWGKLVGVKDTLTLKYTNISNELEGMYGNVKVWEQQLMNNNTIITGVRENCVENGELLENHILVAQEELENMVENDEPNPYNVERQNMLRQQISDLVMSKQIFDHTLQNLDTMRKTNFFIYKKVFSAYNSVLPTIQQTVSVQAISAQHNSMINDLNFMDDVRDRLLISSAESLVSAGTQATQLLDGNAHTFEIIKEAQQIVEEGMRQINALEAQKVEDLNNSLLEYRANQQGVITHG